jgi:class 3 adenylate cyclase
VLLGETRKLAAILVSDVVGYSRLTGADEDRILARLRTLRSDLIDPTIAVQDGRIVKRTGDGSIEFRSVVDRRPVVPKRKTAWPSAIPVYPCPASSQPESQGSRLASSGFHVVVMTA